MWSVIDNQLSCFLCSLIAVLRVWRFVAMFSIDLQDFIDNKPKEPSLSTWGMKFPVNWCAWASAINESCMEIEAGIS